jgi:hypothetical protein
MFLDRPDGPRVSLPARHLEVDQIEHRLFCRISQNWRSHPRLGLIRGSVSSADHTPRQFVGWLELANELDTARKSVRGDRGARQHLRPAQA